MLDFLPNDIHRIPYGCGEIVEIEVRWFKYLKIISTVKFLWCKGELSSANENGLV